MNYNKIETVIKIIPTWKSPEPGSFTVKLYQTFIEKLMPMLCKLFHQIGTEDTLPNSVCEGTLNNDIHAMYRFNRERLQTNFPNKWWSTNSQ